MKSKKLLLIVIIIILIVFVFLELFKSKLLKIIYPKQYNEVVSIYKEQYDVDEELIYAVIKAESNFDKNAISNKGAIGLMQIMEETAKDIARKNNMDIDYDNFRNELLEIDNNIKIGTKYLKTLLDKYQNKEIAVAAYNAGTGTVDNWIENGIIKADGSNIENIPYKETNNYVRKILRAYKIYEELYN